MRAPRLLTKHPTIGVGIVHVTYILEVFPYAWVCVDLRAHGPPIQASADRRLKLIGDSFESESLGEALTTNVQGSMQQFISCPNHADLLSIRPAGLVNLVGKPQHTRPRYMTAA